MKGGVIRRKWFRCKASEDTVDALPKELTFSTFDKCLLLISIVSVFLDTGSDAWVAYKHFQSGRVVYFVLTLACVLVPSWLVTFFSLKWYLADYPRLVDLGFKPKGRWLVVLLHVFQLGIVYRYYNSLVYGIKSQEKKRFTNQRKQYYCLMLWEDNDAAVLRLIESFLESSPQLVLQIYILACGDLQFSTVIAQLVSICTGLISLAWSLVSYSRSLRISLEDKQNMSVLATIVCVLWRVFVILPRVVALGFFASVFTYYLFIVCALRYVIMTCWIMRFPNTVSFESRKEEMQFNLILGGIYIFTYVNMTPGISRFRYTTYYFFTFFENTLLISFWFVYTDPYLWYRMASLLGSVCSFWIGVMFMVIYYLLLHPNGSPDLLSVPVSTAKNGYTISHIEVPSGDPPLASAPHCDDLSEDDIKNEKHLDCTVCLDDSEGLPPGLKVTAV